MYALSNFQPYSRENKGVGIVHNIALPKRPGSIFSDKNGQYLLGKTNPDKFSDQTEMLSKSCYGI